MNYSWILYIIIAFLLSMAATALTMPLLLRLCKRRGMYDIPDERKLHHSHNIPRLGGVLFMPAMLAGVAGVLMLIMMFEGWGFMTLNLTTLMVVIGMFMLYLIGLLDDLFGMPASLKFVIQLVVSIFLPFCGLYIHNLHGLFGLYEIPSLLGYSITVFVTLLIVNAVNLIDGIDGLASSLSFLDILVFGILFYFHGMMFYALYCMALLGTIFVFFLYNMFGNPAKGTKTFMGDTGSLTLGYALAFLAVRYIMTCTPSTPIEMRAMTLLVPFTLVLVPCFDLVRVACMRIKHGKPIFYPDKTHLHHKCLQAGFTMHQALALIVTLQVFFGMANWLLIRYVCNISVVVCFDVCVFVAFTLWLNYRKSKRTSNSNDL